MKSLSRSFVCLALGLAVPALLAQFPGSPQPERTSIKIIQTDDADFPQALRATGVLDGEVWVAINVDSNGKLIDYLVTAYSRKEFADTAVEALKRWEYEPARLHGEPWPSIQEVHVNFSRTGVVVNLTGPEALNAWIDAATQVPFAYRTYSLQELDRIPTPIEVVSPLSPGASKEKHTIIVEFYITETGHVRLPAVIRQKADDIYAACAMEAVKKWRFEPPLHSGRPVLVLAKQQFDFLPAPVGAEKQ